MSSRMPPKKRRRVVVDLAETDDDEAFSVADDDDSSVDLGPVPTPSSDESSSDAYEDEVDDSQDTMSTYEESLLGTQPRSYTAPLKTTASPTRIIRPGTPRPKRRETTTPESLSLTISETQSASSDRYDLSSFAMEATPVPAQTKRTTSPKMNENIPQKPASFPAKPSSKSASMIEGSTKKKKKKDKTKTEKPKLSKQASKKSPKKKIPECGALETAATDTLPVKEPKKKKSPSSKTKAKLDAEPVTTAHSSKSSTSMKTMVSTKDTEAVTAAPKPKKKSTASKPAGEQNTEIKSTTKQPTSASASTAVTDSTSKPVQKPVNRKRKVAKHQSPPTNGNDSTAAPAKKVKEAKVIVSHSKSADKMVKPVNDENKKPANARPQPNTSEKTTVKAKATSGSIAPRPKKRTFQGEILYHMLTSCKPFTLKTLAQELKSTEAALNHVMLSLLDKQLVFKKEFAAKKTTKILYWANQESQAKEAMALRLSPQQMNEARQELDRLQKQDAAIAKELAIVTQEASNHELSQQLKQAEVEVQVLQRQVAEIQNRIKAPPPVTNKPLLSMRVGNQKSAAQLAKERDPQRIKMRINAMRNEWKKRKEKCTDFIDQVADGMEKKVKDVVKLLDIDTDEAEGVVMPPKYVIDPK